MTAETIRVLVIEDNLRYFELAKATLEEHKPCTFMVEGVRTLADGLVLMADRRMRRVGLIVLDLDLPDSDGVDSVKRIQAAAPNTPIVVFSGYASPMAGDCIRAGAQEYISKTDFNVGDITEKVRSAIIRHEVRSRFEPLMDDFKDMSSKLEQLKLLHKDEETGKLKVV